MAQQALSGLKVLEFGGLVSVPYCGKLMADLGAEVIKIEAPGCGDEARHREPFFQDLPGTERSGLFAYLNTNKLGVTLNPKLPKGKSLFEELVRNTDILLENQPPRLMDELGLNYKNLEKVNPMLIMTSITPFGQTGPYRDYKAYELNSYNSGGFGFVSTVTYEEPVMPPVKAGGRQSLFAAAMAGAVATMCAVYARDNIGTGQHVDISIQECLAGQYEAAIPKWTFNKNEVGGLAPPVVQPIMPIPCKDGWVFVMCIEDREFENFVRVMGNPQWAEMELFKDRFTRAEYVDALLIYLSEWSMQYTREEAFHVGQAGGVPIGPAYSSEELLDSEHLTARDYFVQIDHPEIGSAKYPGAPYDFSETPWKIERHAPLLGEHNEDIFCGRLGCLREDLVKFRQMKVV